MTWLFCKIAIKDNNKLYITRLKPILPTRVLYTVIEMITHPIMDMLEVQIKFPN